jgi:hypothetical protein
MLALGPDLRDRAGDSSHKSSLRRWILYGMGAGQEFGPALDFAPLPPVIKRAATAAVGRFSG